MPLALTTSLAAVALFFTKVNGHGHMTFPPERIMSEDYHKAAGALININLSEMQIAPLEGLSQHKQADFPPSPTFNLMNGCRGTVYEEGSKVTTLAAGEDFEVKWEIQAPHPGYLKLSILKPSTDAKNIITYESYKLLQEFDKFAMNGGDNSTNIKMPADVAGCEEPGDCVLQFYWHSDIANQTYMTCADIVVPGSGAGGSAAAAPKASTPKSATPATKAPATPPATDAPAATPKTPSSSATPGATAPPATPAATTAPSTPPATTAPSTPPATEDPDIPSSSTNPGATAPPASVATPSVVHTEVAGEAESGGKCSRRK